MKKITETFLYRSFLVDLLTIKGISMLKRRRVTCQKIRLMEMEYRRLYKTDPKKDFIPVKDKYLLEENSYQNLYKARHKKIKKYATEKSETSKSIFNYSCNDWVKKRADVLRRDNYTCRGCGAKKDLQCHHSYYLNGRKLWEYPLQSFTTLCRCCHEEFHAKIKGSELVIRTKEAIDEKINEEKLLGFIYEKIKLIKNKPTKTVKKKKPNLRKPKCHEVKLDEKDKTLQKKRNRVVVPQWKIDEYKRTGIIPK